MACREPHRHLSGAFIQAVAYAGTEVAPRKPKRSISATRRTSRVLLDEQMFGACAFVRKNMRVAAYKRAAGGRVDIPQFDMTAGFEAVVNAVAHRDYSMAGSKVRLRLADRHNPLAERPSQLQREPKFLIHPPEPEVPEGKQRVRSGPRSGRNAPCPCGTGRKY